MTTVDTNFSENHQRAHGVLGGARLGKQLNTDQERDRAARYVASNAASVDDCRDLLEALGLLDSGARWVQTSRNHRERVEPAGGEA